MKKGIVLRICEFVKTFNREGSHRVFSLPEWDGNDHVGALFRRLPGVTDEMVGFLAIWIRSSVAHWLHLDMLHGNECVPVLIGGQGIGYGNGPHQ